MKAEPPSEAVIIGAEIAAGHDGTSAENLVALANERGGPDNITVVIVRLEKESKGWFSWLRGNSRKNLGSNGTAGGN